MDDSKVQMINPKIPLQLWSNPHYNTRTAIIVKIDTFVKASQDYRKGVNLFQDSNLKPVNFFQDETLERIARSRVSREPPKSNTSCFPRLYFKEEI